MARIHRQTGCLHDLLAKINDPQIGDIYSINEYKRNYAAAIVQIKEKSRASTLEDLEESRNKIWQLTTGFDIKLKENELLLEKEKNEIAEKLSKLSGEPSNLWELISSRIKKYFLFKRRVEIEEHFSEFAKQPLKPLETEISKLTEQLKINEENLDFLVEQRALPALSRLENIKLVLQQNNDLYLGAIGEENVLAELEKLPEPFFVINDFRKEFYPPIYDRKNDDRIYSIQIDHLVCGPTGFFIIETKNWSEDSTQNINLRSPVKQVLRTNFGMFVLLNEAINSNHLLSFINHWGDQKISPINIVATLHAPPPQEFQFVKIVPFYSVRLQIENSKQIFSKENIYDLEKFLLEECS